MSQKDIDCLYRQLRVTKESHNVRVVFVKGTDGMTRYDMMIGMTKPLRRFRATREAEDGELTDSDGEEEEGQIKLEKGDDVALVAHAVGFHLVLSCPDNRFGRSKETTPSKMIIFKR
ncbi:hypothetical protein Angca_000482, partial [Angiostrongylus cantonensis]